LRLSLVSYLLINIFIFFSSFYNHHCFVYFVWFHDNHYINSSLHMFIIIFYFYFLISLSFSFLFFSFSSFNFLCIFIIFSFQSYSFIVFYIVDLLLFSFKWLIYIHIILFVSLLLFVFSHSITSRYQTNLFKPGLLRLSSFHFSTGTILKDEDTSFYLQMPFVKLACLYYCVKSGGKRLANELLQFLIL